MPDTPLVHVLLAALDGPDDGPAAMGLYWPATGEACLQGLPDDGRRWALASSDRRSPLDDSDCVRLGRGLAPGTLLALTAEGIGPQSLVALLEVVAHGPPPDARTRTEGVEPSVPADSPGGPLPERRGSQVE